MVLIQLEQKRLQPYYLFRGLGDGHVLRLATRQGNNLLQPRHPTDCRPSKRIDVSGRALPAVDVASIVNIDVTLKSQLKLPEYQRRARAVS